MVNPKRGELQLTLGKEVLTARLSIDAIIRIEQSVGGSVVQLAQRLSEGKATVLEVVNVLAPAIKGGGNKFTDKELRQKVWDAGLIDGMRCAGEVLTIALASGIEDEGNEQAEEKARKIVQTHYETAQPAQTYRSFHDFF